VKKREIRFFTDISIRFEKIISWKERLFRKPLLLQTSLRRKQRLRVRNIQPKQRRKEASLLLPA
jgi:hypothetical protein